VWPRAEGMIKRDRMPATLKKKKKKKSNTIMGLVVHYKELDFLNEIKVI
jgi:hypothetical protein